MDKRIQTLVNHDGQTVYPVFAPETVPDGRTVEQHFGTFATIAEAEARCKQIDNGTLPTWSEPE